MTLCGNQNEAGMGLRKITRRPPNDRQRAVGVDAHATADLEIGATLLNQAVGALAPPAPLLRCSYSNSAGAMGCGAEIDSFISSPASIMVLPRIALETAASIISSASRRVA